MADAIVSFAQGKLIQILQQPLKLFAGTAEELERIKETFQSIEAVLTDAESRQVAEEGVQLWLSRLRNVAYDIDDVLTEWQISNDGSNVGGATTFLSKWCTGK
ncbi:hypothetical protein ACLOJK_040440 [Asimina triloba]